MILAIISAVVCFGAAVLIFTPSFRKIALLRPMAYYLFFQGVWQLISYIVLQIAPTNGLINPVNYIGTIIILGYYIFILLINSKKINKLRKRYESDRKE